MLDIQAVAQQLGISPTTVRRLVRDGELPAYKVGGRIRFKQGDIDEFLAARRIIPRTEEQEKEPGGT
jgi:excisionase family DNA binding protein